MARALLGTRQHSVMRVRLAQPIVRGKPRGHSCAHLSRKGLLDDTFENKYRQIVANRHPDLRLDSYDQSDRVFFKERRCCEKRRCFSRP